MKNKKRATIKIKNKKEEIRWKVLTADENNPANVHNNFSNSRQPTDPKGIDTINKSRNQFAEMIERPEFSGRQKIPMM